MPDQIQINQLLMEREDRLVEISDLERQISTILGEPYPLVPPDGLPSRLKRKKAARKAAAAVPVIRLRKLDETTAEAAYRFTYLDGETEKTEIHTDPRPLALLANTPLPNITVLRIETVAPDGTGWKAVDLLHEQHTPSA